MTPNRIIVGLTGRAWGGVAELTEARLLDAHIVIGSMYVDRASFEQDRPVRMFDGRVEIGRSIADAPALCLRFVGDGSPGCVTRDQVMTAVRVCAMWRATYRGERGKLPFEAADEIRRGEHRFDIEGFRGLVINWEQSNRAMREYPSKHSVAT